MIKEKKHSYEQLMIMRQVKDLLGVSYGLIYALIREDRLDAVKVTGEPVSRHEVDETVQGLRFSPSVIRKFLQESAVK